jgi:Uma2 family endonuclease
MAVPLRKMPDPSWSDDPFRYGTRWKQVRLPNGEIVDQPIPLTPDDLLDPQLGDEVPQSDPHAQVATSLYGLLKRHFEPLADMTVFFDMKIEWGVVPYLPGPSPDVMVLRGLPRRQGRTIYRVAEEGVIPCLVFEVASYSDAAVYQNDHEKKVEIYRRARVPEYLIVDPPFPPEEGLMLTGYRLTSDGRYRRIKPDSQGRLHSETTGLFFAPSEDGSTVRVGDAATGEWLLTPSEESDARRAAEERARSAEAENARLRAELERLKSR